MLAAGGFDHELDWRRKFQSESLGDGLSLGSEATPVTRSGWLRDLGADIALMDQAWWFPRSPLPDADPLVMLANGRCRAL